MAYYSGYTSLTESLTILLVTALAFPSSPIITYACRFASLILVE